MMAGILFFDNNCFLKAPLHTLIKYKNIEYSTGQSKLYPTFFLLDESGGKYKVTGWLHGYVNTGDSLLVTRSVLFNKSIRLEYHKEGEYIIEDIGVLNADWFGKGFPLFCMFLCVIALLFYNRISNERIKLAVVFFPAICLVTIIAFYFIFST